MLENPQTEPFLKAMAYLSEFEASGFATTWKHEGFHVWPIVKYVLVKQLIKAMNSGYRPTDTFHTHPRFVGRRQPFKGLKGRLRARAEYSGTRKLLPLSDLHEYPIWCFGSASGLAWLEDIPVSQHHHALRVALWEKGIPSVGLYSATQGADFSHKPRYGVDHSLDAFIHSTVKTARVKAVVTPYLDAHFAQVDDVVMTTGHPKPALMAFIDLMIGRTAHVIKSLSPIFRARSPKAVFTSNYASFYGWALAYLCRRSGVPFVDIQHGLQGRYGGAYYFSITPEHDWSIFPTAQLCWSESDATVFRDPLSSRRAAVIGPTWTRFAQFLPAEQTEALTLPNEFTAQDGPVVLFAGQHPEDILLAHKLRVKGLRVLYRGHPTQRNASLDLLDESEVAGLYADFASKAVLPALLDRVDGVVTGYSAVILEACLRQVPCLATGAFADFLFDDYASEVSGLLRTCPQSEGEDLLSTIFDWSSKLPARSEPDGSSLKPMSEVLSEIGLSA